ncbi:diguanylate cyclase [Rhodoferax ferrireducens]|uniref:diguanylate cyclase n=1 Tax=Rhodoferax ferrireducens TaxID=192843 RepID=UPI00298D840B|nr:diguanylate cyclase [Rhodoferax ferrireducens]WPC66769.1 diguanylate cyclase [Rhodoferax ferrireducens]
MTRYPETPPKTRWLVRMHHRMRAGSLALMFVASGMHIFAKNYGIAAWTLLALLFLLYPHVQYWRAARAADSVKTELDNLLIDSFLLGLFMAALEFPLWLSFAAIMATLTNNAANKGWPSVPKNVLAMLAGALIWVTVRGFKFSPDTGWPLTIFCMVGICGYVLVIGNVGFQRNLQLRRVREELRTREQELLKANQSLVVNLQEIEALQQQLREQASRDSLTALYNRRYLDTTLDRELASCKREGKPLSLIMIDVDDFKKYNDLHGHQAGDQCLIAVAKTLQASAKRASDLAARYGGEEFLLVLPGMDATAAQGLAEELRRSVEALKIPHEQSRGGSVTISIGLAVMTNDSHKDVAGLLRAADEALYHAKHGGRNQVRLAAQTRRAARVAESVAVNLVQLVWHPAYESGQAELDAQHRALFGHVNNILAALLLERPVDEVAALIDTLIGDVAKHFEDEEKIILAAGFPGAAAHAAMHRELIAHAGYLVSRFKTRDLDRGEPFQFLAHDLVARHILGEDREFFPHLSA